MKIDSSIIMAIIALSAIVSPVIVAIINNKHNSKLRALELNHIHRKEFQAYHQSIFVDYLKSASECIAYPTESTIREYGKCYSITFAYFPPKAYGKLQEINMLIRAKNWDEANEKLEELSIWIADLMKYDLTGLRNYYDEKNRGKA